MKRSTLSIVLMYAAIGFATTAAVRFAGTLQADDAPVVAAPDTKVSTKTFDLVVQYNADSHAPEAVATNTTDQEQTAQWTVRVLSTGPIRPESRVGPIPKEVSSDPVSLTLAPHESKSVAIFVPKQDAKSKKKSAESISVVVDAGGLSLRVPTSAVRAAVALNR